MGASVLSQFNAALKLFGLDIPKGVRTVAALPRYLRDYRKLKRALRQSDAPFPIRRLVPCLLDRTESSGTASGGYFHQDLLVASKVFEKKPARHVDVGSSVHGFVAHVASFREIEVFDIRPLHTSARNIVFRQADFMADDMAFAEYTDSLSCLHTIEHFGLGRYGDTIDPDGHIKGLNNLYRMLQPDGTFYFSAPIGPQRIEFNAHRVFDLAYLLSLFKGRYELASFSCVDDGGELVREPELTPERIACSCGCRCGIGIFELRKLSD